MNHRDIFTPCEFDRVGFSYFWYDIRASLMSKTFVLTPDFIRSVFIRLASDYAYYADLDNESAKEQIQVKCWDEFVSGGAEYVADKDVLGFAKKIADKVGLTPVEIYRVLLAKHVIGLDTYLDNPENTEYRRDTMLGRMADTINYTYLLYLAQEEQNEK